MEEVFDLYDQPYDASYSVIGMDEQPKPWRRNADAARHTTTHTLRRGACTLLEPLGQ